LRTGVAPAALILGAFAGLLSLGSSTAAGFTDTTETVGSSIAADVLDPPTALTATTGAAITLQWTATPDVYADGHRLLRSTTPGGPYVQIAETTPRTVETHVDSAPPGTYYYVVRAFAGAWESVDSAEAMATSIPPNPGNTKNCTDFATQAEAQAWFDLYYPYYGDVALLDADNDLIACETLP
jgi:hypothetical protein